MGDGEWEVQCLDNYFVIWTNEDQLPNRHYIWHLFLPYLRLVSSYTQIHLNTLLTVFSRRLVGQKPYKGIN